MLRSLRNPGVRRDRNIAQNQAFRSGVVGGEYGEGVNVRMKGFVEAVCSDHDYRFSKPVCESVRLIAGHGVEGDAHAGATVKHRVRLRRDPESPNLRQVHLLPAELLDELNAVGFSLAPGQIGENILTRGLELIELPVGTRLRLGDDAIVEVTGLRDPCNQLDKLRPGLMKAVLDRDEQGELIRKAGVMSIVVEGGNLNAGDEIVVELPSGSHQRLAPV